MTLTKEKFEEIYGKNSDEIVKNIKSIDLPLFKSSKAYQDLPKFFNMPDDFEYFDSTISLFADVGI